MYRSNSISLPDPVTDTGNSNLIQPKHSHSYTLKVARFSNSLQYSIVNIPEC